MREAVFRWGALLAGFVLSLHAAMWSGGNSGLPSASLIGYGTGEIRVEWQWDQVAVCVLAMILLTGAQRWAVGWLNVSQLGAAVWLAALTIFWSLMMRSAGWIPVKDHGCVRTGCWPDGVQEWLGCAPMLLACIAMVVVACRGRSPWWLRALVPAAVFLSARIIQVSLWGSVILPWLNGPR